MAKVLAELAEAITTRFAAIEERIDDLSSSEHGVVELRQMLHEAYEEKQKCYFAISQFQTANTNLLANKKRLTALLDEVLSNYTRDDDLPNNLLTRIDAAIAPRVKEQPK